MHFLRLLLAFIQKLCLLSFIFPKIDKKGGGWNKSAGSESVSKIDKRKGGDYSVIESERHLLG